MNDIFARLAGGPKNLQQRDYDDWNEMVGSAPPEQFGRATYDSIRRVDPSSYSRHVTPGVDGTDPLGELPPQRRSDLMRTLLGELQRRGIDQTEISREAGVRRLDPNRASPNDLASLLQYTQQNHPKAYGRVAAQHQTEPDILQSLLGNEALMGVISSLGTKLVMDQMNKRSR